MEYLRKIFFKKERNTIDIGPDLSNVLRENERWARTVTRENPEFFRNLAKGQKPPILWIGCSDSRVPPVLVCGLQPGDIFVHRNIGNGYFTNDKNCNAVIDYAVHALGVRHIVLCGHYCCGAVGASLGNNTKLEVVEAWIRQIRQLYSRFYTLMSDWPIDMQKEIMCEINAVYNARKLAESKSVQQAWKSKKPLSIHAWCFRLSTGRIEDLGFSINNEYEAEEVCRKVMEARIRQCVYFKPPKRNAY